MPFKSKSQHGYLFANKPKVAREFASKTKKSEYGKLPDKAQKTDALKRRLGGQANNLS